MRNGARLKRARNISRSISKILGSPGVSASVEVRRFRLVICKCFLLYISFYRQYSICHMRYCISHLAYGSPAEKVPAENLPIAPFQQRERRERQISLRLACAHNYGLNRAPIRPQMIDHKTIRVGARVHPSDLGTLVQQTDVLQLQKHAGRVARVLLIECDLEGERSDPGEKVQLVGDWAAVKTEREHHQFAAPESLPGDLHEVLPVSLVTDERAPPLPFPAVSLELQKLLDPGVDVGSRFQRRVFEPAGLCKAPFLTLILFSSDAVQ